MSATSSTPPPGPSQDPLARLVRAAGPRAVPDPSRAARARDAVHAEWRGVLAQRRTQRWRWLTAATVAATASGLGLLATLRPGPPVAVASISRVSGDVERRAERGQPGTALAEDAALYAGDEIETAPGGRALVRWAHWAMLRIDGGSVARVESEDHIRLVRGALYLETAGTSGAGLVVSTPFGHVRHVGTRFEVRVGRDGVRVRVRDGIAIFAGNTFAPVVIEAGRQLSVAGGKALLEEGPVASDPQWGWTQTIAPRFAIEGRSLLDTLEWLAHEAGLRVIYASPAVRDKTRGVVLHGSIEGLDLHQALTAVLSGSGVEYVVRADRIEIRDP
ncbi:MAG TPA: FecR family protein [Steroidobacteraceae bacterium]|nr:FecR family protein [Steroidobacteraceae bacterium]